MKIAIARFCACAASETSNSSSVRSFSRLPLSASPRIGSAPIPTSPIFSESVPAKFRSAISALRIFSFAFAEKSKSSKIFRKPCTKNSPTRSFSPASAKMVRNPFSFAICSSLQSRTVFPTPRSPVNIRLFSGRPNSVRPNRISACSKMRPRPTSSGGGVPAPGEKGLRIGSIALSGFTQF